MPEELKPTMTQNFIHDFIDEDIAQGGQFQGMTVHTRFPPEPNGYLHIGHAKAIFVDFGTAEKYGGLCNLRMDDTNPTKEDVEYVEAIQEDIHWLGYDWGGRFFFASDYFEKMYEYAVELIKKGLAYVCELTPEQFKEYRGDVNTPARSPFRDRPIEESLDLFARMRAGEFPNGAMTLRAKIDLPAATSTCATRCSTASTTCTTTARGTSGASTHVRLRHPLEDALEGITHSLCSLEFEDHRPLYDWVIANCPVPARPRQIEFARLGINYTVMSKRKLRQLVEEGRVSGWDDPRMPTLCGLRRRGYTPRAIRNFSERNGVSKAASTVEYAFLEHCLREDLNETAQRRMAVLRPVRLIITNYPRGAERDLLRGEQPQPPGGRAREVTFSRELYIEAEDFLPAPVPKYKRLYPDGPECRLKGAYVIKCTGYETDAAGDVTAILAEYDPDSRGGDPADGRKVKGPPSTGWTPPPPWTRGAAVRQPVHRRRAGRRGQELPGLPQPQLLEVLPHAKVEAGLAGAEAPASFQFLRQGYFCVDNKDSAPGHLVFNRSVSLKDSFKF